MTIIIPNLAVAGYRSFGEKPQYFDQFAKINLLIGKNNSGKSNVLRLLADAYPTSNRRAAISGKNLISHIPGYPPTRVGIAADVFPQNGEGRTVEWSIESIRHQVGAPQLAKVQQFLEDLLRKKCEQEKTDKCWLWTAIGENTSVATDWASALSDWPDGDLYAVFCILNPGSSSGSRERHWIPAIVRALMPRYPRFISILVPANRQIDASANPSNDFDGSGIVQRLAALQNPEVMQEADRERFGAITRFVQSVLNNSSVVVEVPHTRKTVQVRIDGKMLPIESLGSGIQEVIILAAAATVFENHVVCIEEPEIHLNPILQKKLIRYLATETSNQYFITTHSPALMDTPDVETYHIRLVEGASTVERATSDAKRRLICEDLGYHPSDLLQSNCLIWVEGPSDRIYLNWWIAYVDPNLVEGIHYSVMFYAGRLASHLSNAEPDIALSDFIALRRINQRGVIVIDSDKSAARIGINATKKRLRDEFNQGPGFAWVTEGREIENYLPVDQLREVISDVIPTATPTTSFGKFENCLAVRRQSGKVDQAPKVEVARRIASKHNPDLSLYDLRKRVEELVAFIRASNPAN